MSATLNAFVKELLLHFQVELCSTGVYGLGLYCIKLESVALVESVYLDTINLYEFSVRRQHKICNLMSSER